MNILDNFRSIFLGFIFFVRRSIDVLDPENHPRSDKIMTGPKSYSTNGQAI